MIQSLIVVVSWIGLFFVKKLLYKVILAVLQLITRPIDYFNNRLDNIISPITDFKFPRILLNFMLLIFAGFMLVAEYSSLNTSMVYYFKGASLDILPDIEISSVIAITYISITLILGVLGLEMIGFRKILLGVLYENQSSGESISNWLNLKNDIVKPITLFRIIVGIVFLGCLFYFAHLQGKISIDRELMINRNNKNYDPSDIVVSLLYALGFFIPILTAVTFMSIEIFVATVTKAISIILNLTLKGVGIGYDISKRSIEFITSPIELITTKINLATNNRTEKYLSPLEILTKSGELNEILLFRKFNSGNSIVNDLSSHIADKVESKMEDEIEHTIDDLF